MRKLFHFGKKRLLLLTCLLLSMLFAGALHTLADDDVRPSSIKASGKKTITVQAGRGFDLKVRTSPNDADEDYLKWSIVSGSKYVRFDDDDRYDDEIELKAKKAGTAKVRCTIRGTKKQVTFTVKVKKSSTSSNKKIKAVSSKTRTVRAGQDFSLQVRKYYGLNDWNLKWSIQDTSIVRFDDDDRYDDEVEFRARNAGTTKIYCKNKKTGQTITFTVTVTPRSTTSNHGNRYDDDYDDRYDDDWYDDDYDDRYDDDYDDWYDD